MTHPKSLADLKDLCGRKEKLRSVSKDTIAEIIMNDLSTGPSESADRNSKIEELIKNLTQEVRELKESNKEVLSVVKRVNNIESELSNIKAENKRCLEIMHQQQLYLEEVDAKNREHNVIITGITEEPD